MFFQLVSVVLIIQYGLTMRHVTLHSLAYLAVKIYSIPYHMNQFHETLRVINYVFGVVREIIQN
jgi:hypothetical protein